MKKLLATIWMLCGLANQVVQAQATAALAATERVAEPATSEPSFDVVEYVIEGNTLLSAGVIERALMPFMGPDRKFSDLEQARSALEKTYQDAGYLSVLVSLPNQRVDSGEVRMEVTEAPLEKVAVSGANYHLPSRIRQAMPSLKLGEVPRFPQVQKEVAALQTDKLQVTPLVNASDSGKGIEVDLKVEDKLPLAASLEMTNGQSYNTTRGRVAAAVTASNLFQRGHSFGLNWQYAPYRPKDSNTLSLIYSVPLSSTDDLLASLTESRSDTPTKVSGTAIDTIVTKGTFIGLRWSHRLDAMAWPVRHNVYAAVDYKDSRETKFDANGVDIDPILYPVLAAGYSLTHNNGSDEVYTISAAVKGSTQALAGRKIDCDGVQREQFDCKRAGTSADFLAWQLGVGHSRPVFKDWRLNLNADLQVANGQLPSSEQYSLGGPSTVRGYYDFEQSGDEGWNARAELVTPVLMNVAGVKATALGFADRGLVKIINPTSTQIARTHMGSQGLGLRLSNGEDGLELGVDIARVAFDTVRPTDSGQTEFASGPKADRRYRLDLSLRQSF